MLLPFQHVALHPTLQNILLDGNQISSQAMLAEGDHQVNQLPAGVRPKFMADKSNVISPSFADNTALQNLSFAGCNV
jgi:hypothetical protein